jgi:hypothetical protein
MLRKSAVAAAVAMLFALPALAQNPPAAPPVRVRGTIEQVVSARRLEVPASRGPPSNGSLRFFAPAPFCVAFGFAVTSLAIFAHTSADRRGRPMVSRPAFNTISLRSATRHTVA